MTEIKGRHVLGMFLLAFGTIIAVNATLAVNAVQTFPGLETRNSYVASQAFEASRAAQEALEWAVSAELSGDLLMLRIARNGDPVEAEITEATFGRATTVAYDQSPAFSYTDGIYVADVAGGAGNWNLRLRAIAPDGTTFQQRIIVTVTE